MASRQLAESERIVAGWRELIHRMQSDGRDVTAANDMLKDFEDELRARRSNRDQIVQAARTDPHGTHRKLRRLFRFRQRG